MNGISSWSIRNPVPTTVLFVALTLAGLLGFAGLRTNDFPDIDLPAVTVTVGQPGAAPSELETQVTRIVEDAVAGVNDVDHITSTVDEGTSTTMVQFLISTNVDRATNDVRNAISSVQAKLPSAAEQPVIQRALSTGGAILTFVVEAPGKSPEELSWFVENDIAKRLLAVRGVAKVERAGGVDRAIRVRLDPNRLVALGLTAGRISQALASVNVDQPGGRMTIGAREQTVRTVGGAATLEAVADVNVALSDGVGVRLGDLGSVKDGGTEPRQRARLDGRSVVAFSVYRTIGSSEVDVTRNVRAVIAAMNGNADARMEEVTSSTGFITQSYDASIEALWIGALLAIAVVWLFLRDLRATIVASVALPLSLIPTFAVMDWFDVSLNTITLLALSLVVGILVDDAIVEIENIVRHMRQSGKSAYLSAIEAADEIGLAVLATTMTLVAVFLPVAFMPGIPGKIFASFAIATCVSVLFSLLVARTLTPLLGAYFVKAGAAPEESSRAMTGYLWLLRKAMNHRWKTVVLGLLFLAGSMALASRLPTDFIVASDRGRSVVSVDLPPGATLEQTDAVVLEITKIFLRHAEVENVYAAEGTQTSAGMGNAGSAGEVRSAKVTANLKQRGLRKLSQQALEKLIAPELAAIPGARIQFGGDGQSGAKISVTLVGDDGPALASASGALQTQMRAVPGFVNPYSTSSLRKPEVIIAPDTAKAAELGVTTTAIAQAIDIATLGDNDENLPKFNLPDRQLSIIVSLDEAARNDPAELANLPILGTRSVVPLGAVADIRFGSGPNEISRFDRHRSATVEVEMEGLTLGQATAAVAALPIIQRLPEGVTEQKSGDGEHLQELLRGFVIAIGSGITLMFLTLVLLFNGFLQPLTILVALPLSIGGALGTLLLCGYSLSITALIGLLMLMGIAAKNSILLVEYAILAMRERGLSNLDALMDAAAKRARPIVMTSIAMCAGMAPVALGLGADAESRAPMAVAVIGGLISSTALSLIYVPVVFSLMDGLQVRLGRWLGRLVASQKQRPVRGAASS